MADKKINVGGRLHSIATGNVLAGADEILDDNKGKKQSEINIDVDNALVDRYTKDETYNKNQLNSLITTPDVQYVIVSTYSQLPATGSADTIYKVSSYDGTVVDATKYAEYAWDGSGYVLLSVKSAVDEIFDISVFNAESGIAKKYKTLTAALTDIPSNRHKGGINVKFIQSPNNKYVQYRLTASEWSIDTNDWIIDEGLYVENSDFVRVVTDSEDKILYGVKSNGEFYFGAGCPQQVKDYVQTQIDILMGQDDITEKIDTINEMIAFFEGIRHDETLQNLLQTNIAVEKSRAEAAEQALSIAKVDKEEGKSLIDSEFAEGVSQIENPEFAEVHVDKEDKILYGVKQNGDFYFGAGVPSQIQEELDSNITEVAEVVANKVDKEEGKALIDAEYASSQSTLNNPEFIQVTIDSEGRLLAGRTPDGEAFETVGFSTPKASVNGHTLENVEDPEERIEAVTDSEGKVISYRDGDGVVHEKVGIVTKKLEFINNDSLNVFRGTILPSCNTVKEAVENKMTGLVQVGENVVVGLNSLDGEYTVADIEKNYRNILPNPKFPFIKKVSIHRLYDDAATPNMLFICSHSDKHIFYSICPTDTKRAFGNIDAGYYNKYNANYFYYADKNTPSDIHKVVLPSVVNGLSMNKQISYVLEMSNGDCLVEIANNPFTPSSTTYHKNLYIVKGVFSNNTITEEDVTLSLSFDKYLEKVSSFDNIVEYKAGHILLAPYSGAATGKVYISKDYGSTWDLIFCMDVNNETHFIKPKAEHFGESDAYGVYPTSDLLNPEGELNWNTSINGNYHVHGIAYDAWYDRIWVVTGDGDGQIKHNITGIWWTDDEGYTWKRIGGGKEIHTQAIGIIPMEHCVLFPSDGGGNGFWRWSRNGKDTIIDIEECYNYLGFKGNELLAVGQRSIKCDNGFYAHTFAPNHYDGGYKGGIVVTPNGFDFEKIYEDGFIEEGNENATIEIGWGCDITDCGNKLILEAYQGGYIELNY